MFLKDNPTVHITKSELSWHYFPVKFFKIMSENNLDHTNNLRCLYNLIELAATTFGAVKLTCSMYNCSKFLNIVHFKHSYTGHNKYICFSHDIRGLHSV